MVEIGLLCHRAQPIHRLAQAHATQKRGREDSGTDGAGVQFDLAQRRNHGGTSSFRSVPGFSHRQSDIVHKTAKVVDS